jgi:addiction module HigA family antidote
MIDQHLRNPHPGEMPKVGFLAEIGISQNRLAHAIGVLGNGTQEVVNGNRDISADTDVGGEAPHRSPG